MPPSFGPAAPEAAPEAAPGRWWRVFEDEQLNQLQKLAMDANFSLRSFRDRRRAAKAVVRGARSQLFPTVDGSAFVQTTLRQRNDFSSDEQFGLSAIGLYDVDVWGEVEAGIDATLYEQAVASEQLRAAAITLSGDIALTWYALVEQRGQRRILFEQIETNEKVLSVVRARFGGGVVRASDVLRQERLLESTREQLATVQANIEVIEHALLVLIGSSPTEALDMEREALPEMPPVPQLGVPSDVVSRRPDVRAALLSIRAADARVAQAIADQYPSVTIGLNATTIEEQIGDLFDNWASTLSIDVLGPIFDAGLRKAEVERTQAVKTELVNRYAQQVLDSIREVVDALAREEGRTEQIERINRQLELARRTTNRLNREYLNGDISYIDVLEALTTEQQLQRDLLSARLAVISDRVSLHQALAGGWEGIIRDDNHAKGEASP